MLIGATMEMERLLAERPRADKAQASSSAQFKLTWSLQLVDAGVALIEDSPRLFVRLRTTAHELADPKLLNIEIQHVVICELDTDGSAELRKLVPIIQQRRPSTEEDQQLFHRMINDALEQIPSFVLPDHVRQASAALEFLGTKPDSKILSVFSTQAAELVEKRRRAGVGVATSR